jgi:ribosomal protein S18 acetylase RimI-like enzyme
MEITVPDTGEADRLVELWLALADGQRTYGSHLLVEENSERIRESILRHVVSGSLLVARDGAVVGFVMFSTETGSYEQDRSRGVIENLYVVPDRRGEGIGTALLEAAETRLGELGADAIALDVMADNESARRFYRDRGYRPHRVELEKPAPDDR